KASEKPPERVQKRSERVRRAEPPKPEVVDSTESIPVSDEDSDAMVDDPNDEDFVPFRPRRSPRMSLRSSVSQRAGRSAVGTKMTCAHCRTPLQKGQTKCVRVLGEIWNTKDSVVAQTGSGGSFHEFCTSVCLSLYESGDPADATRCSICQKTGEVLHEVSNGSVVHRLCSDSCFSKFRANKGLKTNCCDQCGAYIYTKTGSPGPELLFHEGQQKRFCNTTCLGQNTRVYPCVWCKTLCKNFEMLSHVDRNGKTSLFCSLCCTTSYKVKQAGLTGPPRPCSFCRRSLSDPCYYNKVDRTVYQFCSPSCWTKFQVLQPRRGIHLSCHYCHSLFSGKPEVLDWQDQVFQFCCRDCCEDFKRLRGVVSQCEHCRQEKLLHEKLRFSGVEKSFCSEGCVLLYKQDFTKKLGLCCITCTYCSQTCQRGVTEQLDGSTWDFCSEDCKSKYLLWYCKAARCHACKRQGKLLETIHWRGQIRHFCNQQCLLRFYSQQNQPNLDTQSGPESLLNSQSPESKPQTPSQTKVENSNTVRTPEENGNLGKVGAKAKGEDNLRGGCGSWRHKCSFFFADPCEDPIKIDFFFLSFLLDPLDINPSVDFLFDCGLVGPEDVSTEQDLPRTMRKGQKRLVLSESCSRDSMSSQPSCTGLNYSYGVNAWKCWVQSKYANGETSKAKPMRIKEDILACSAAELNYGLAQFVREITRPNGERYEPDSIYYLCLGIQQYLLENNRMVNIFTDLYYLTFVQELNKSLSTWQPTLLPNNTGPGKRKREDEAPILEQRENRMNPLRCPVKFYEFYLSKCPESLRTRNDVFYLQPERSCIAESPLWYSVIPMDRSMLESMLNRILAVREIYEELGRPGEEDLD
uniref:TRASH domain-containing protein n=1 Tax=Rhinopithecus bieti TaxID=61621 RepID=A0A2K6MEK5_RHIBE